VLIFSFTLVTFTVFVVCVCQKFWFSSFPSKKMENTFAEPEVMETVEAVGTVEPEFHPPERILTKPRSSM